MNLMAGDKQNMNKIIWGLYAGLSVVIALASGCSNAGNGSGKAPDDNKTAEPITLNFKPSYSMTDAQVEAFIKEPVKKKFPHITVNVIKFGSGVTWENSIIADQIPDFWGAPYKDTELFVKLGISEDLNPFVAKHKVDTSRFEPTAMSTIQSFAGKGELYGLPYETHYGALFYNKDIFDKFAVPYPKDGMTWDDAIALARKVTKTDNGTAYIGLDPTSPAAVNTLTGGSVGTGNHAQVNNDNWKKVFSMLNQVYEVPGFVQGKKYTYGVNSFLKDKTLAMYAGWENDVLGKLNDMEKQGDSFKWDMVTHPNFKENVGQGRDAAAHAFFISNKSKHKEEAFEVIKLLTEGEVQGVMNRQGVLTVLPKTDEVKREYGKEIPVLQGKNTAAIFKMKPSPAVTHKYYSIISSELSKAAGSVALKEKDVNTALRDAEEEANKKIAAEVKKEQ